MQQQLRTFCIMLGNFETIASKYPHICLNTPKTNLSNTERTGVDYVHNIYTQPTMSFARKDGSDILIQ